MEKFNKILAFIGVAVIVLAMLIQFNAYYGFLGILAGYAIVSNIGFYAFCGFVFVFSFLNLFKKKVIPIILITVMTLAFILLIIMTAAPDIILKIIPIK